MKIAKRAVAILMAIVLIASLMGCGTDLTGKWRSTSEKRTQLAFSSGSKVTMSADGIELSGTYTAVNGELTMTMTAPDGEVYVIEASYEISDKKLYLENDKGQIEVFER